MSIAEKLTTVAENVPKVYEAGQKSEYDRFWDSYVPAGDIIYGAYRFAGQGWNDKTFRPNKNIKIGTTATGMFRQSVITNMKECLGSYTLDMSTVTSASACFGYMEWLTVMPKINLSSLTNASYLFQSDTRLTTIEELTVSEKTTFTSASSFADCTSLTHLIMTGTLATNGLDLHWSPLDKESLLSILGVLQDKTSVGGTWKVTLGTENLAKLSDAEKAIATQKGWTLV